MDLQTINITLHKEQTKEKCIAERRKNDRMEELVNWQRVLMEVWFDQILGHSILLQKDCWFSSHFTT